MKRNQSYTQAPISTFYFAVYPIALTIERGCNSKIVLYFEKNPQIINKFETQNSDYGAQAVAHFPIPKQVQHFRIQSDKNLQYQWSLYVRQDSSDDENEEFLEAQKINLKDQWQSYLQKRESVTEIEQEFNAVRSKLRYILVIGKNVQQLLEIVQQKWETVINPKPIQENVEAPLKVQSYPMIEETEPMQLIQDVSNLKMQTQRQQTDIIENLIQIKPQDLKQSVIVSVSPQKGEKYFNNLQTPSKRVIEQESAEKNIKLSLSELEIGENIAEDIEHYERVKTPPAEQERILDAIGQQIQKTGKEIGMTSSQLLNEKREAIIPPYKNKKYIAILIIISLLILSGYLYFSKSKKKPIQHLKSPKTQKGKQKGKEKAKQKVKQTKQKRK